MKHLVGFLQWLLERDIRTKNATSVLGALLSVIVFYFVSKPYQWFHDLHQEYGAGGTAVAMLAVFLAVFLGVWLVYSGIAAHHGRVATRRQAQQKVQQQQSAIRNNLESLTEWQCKFLLRFIVEDRRQIPAFEVGRYKAAWDFEMDVLIAKNIIKQHRGEVYEIHPLYHAYLIEHWDPATGTLGQPNA